jgi:hypothetical protein
MQHYGFHEGDAQECEKYVYTLEGKKELQFYVPEGLQCVTFINPLKYTYILKHS